MATTEAKAPTQALAMPEIDESAFTGWCCNNIPLLLRPYAESVNIDDLTQDAWLAAFHSLRKCQCKGCGVNYGKTKQFMRKVLLRKNLNYTNKGVTYTNQSKIEFEGDIELKAVDYVKPMSANIAPNLRKWFRNG